jgi:hypothetical protein
MNHSSNEERFINASVSSFRGQNSGILHVASVRYDMPVSATANTGDILCGNEHM